MGEVYRATDPTLHRTVAGVWIVSGKVRLDIVLNRDELGRSVAAWIEWVHQQ